MPPGIAAMKDRMRWESVALRADRSGATAIEYALVAGLISLSIVFWAAQIGTSVSGFFTTVASGL